MFFIFLLHFPQSFIAAAFALLDLFSLRLVGQMEHYALYIAACVIAPACADMYTIGEITDKLTGEAEISQIQRSLSNLK